MTYSPTFGQTGTETDPFGIPAQTQVVKVEFVIDSHLVTGEVRYGGPPRRLVDLLNALDSGYTTIYDGSIADPLRFDDEAKRFEVAQVRRDAIIYAIPRDGGSPSGNYEESVRKVPVYTCLALPGCDITGNYYHVPDADPATVPVLSGRSFVPLTEAVITPTGKAEAVREALVVVNVARVLVYAPGTRRG